MNVRNQERTADGDVKYFSRLGHSYTALYERSGKLFRLERNANTHGLQSVEIPHDSQSFRRLADGNRGNRFVPV